MTEAVPKEGTRMVKGINFIGLVALASGTVTGVGFLMMSGDIVASVGSLNLIWCYVIGMAAETVAMLSTATIASCYPSAGSVATYARKVIGSDTLGFLTAIALWLGMISIDGAELMALGRYIYFFFPQIHYFWWGFIVTVLFIGINLMGVVLTSRTQSILGILMWSALFAVPLAVLSSGKADISYWAVLKESIGFTDWMTSIFFGVYCYVGFVTILPAAEETEKPEKKIPAALVTGTVITGIIYISGGLAIISLRPENELLALAPEGPFASVWVKAMEILWDGKGAVFMNWAAISTALTTANACIYGGARMLYGMARERQLPEAFRRISEKHKTPTVPILVTGGFILFSVFSGAIRVVSVIANFVFFPLWLVISVASYINLSNIKVNGKKYKDVIPFYIPGGKLWPVLSIIMSSALTILTFFATDDVVMGGSIAVLFLVICWVYYVWWKNYNLKQGIDIVAEAAKHESVYSDWQKSPAVFNQEK
ncbi:MAG: APC family permease [Spirochaetia bacterium]|jgi:amino acid transporter|nr:APC family permease [Spirochaetia bacterium]